MTRLIDADVFKKNIINLLENEWGFDGIREDVSKIIDNVPTIASAVEWIEMKTRPATPEEIENIEYLFGETIDTMFDCPLPDDGEECLISTTWGGVYIDQFDAEYNSFCDHDDPDDVVAWAKLPEPYKKT